MGELSGLPNIGPKIEEQLKAVGIDTAEELRRIGAEDDKKNPPKGYNGHE